MSFRIFREYSRKEKKRKGIGGRKKKDKKKRENRNNNKRGGHTTEEFVGETASSRATNLNSQSKRDRVKYLNGSFKRKPISIIAIAKTNRNRPLRCGLFA